MSAETGHTCGVHVEVIRRIDDSLKRQESRDNEILEVLREMRLAQSSQSVEYAALRARIGALEAATPRMEKEVDQLWSSLNKIRPIVWGVAFVSPVLSAMASGIVVFLISKQLGGP